MDVEVDVQSSEPRMRFELFFEWKSELRGASTRVAQDGKAAAR